MKRGKISKSIANAGAKGVSRVNAIIQKTSKAVKVLRSPYSARFTLHSTFFGLLHHSSYA